MNRLFSFLFILLVATPAWAQPSSGLPGLLDLQGHLRTENGQAVNKIVSLRVALYDASSGGNLLYSEDIPLVPVVGGRFSVRIGAVSALPVDLFVTRSTVFAGISVDGSGELPRQQLVPVAYAFKSSHAARASLADLASGLDCQACVDGTRLADEAVTGNKILDGSIGTSELSGGAVTASKLGEPCAQGEILKKKPGGWACAPDDDSTYTGADFALSNQLCSAGQLAKGFGPDGLLVCGKDEGTTYTAGNGLALDGTQFSIKFDVTDARYVNEAQANAVTSLMVVDGTLATDDLAGGAVTTSKLADGAVTAAKLGEACKSGEILKKTDSGWACGADGGNTYSGADFTLSGQTCAAGHVVKAVGPDGLLVCVADETGAVVAGPGLVLDGSKLSLPLTCAAGNVLKWNATAGAWECAADADTKYVAGLGLKLDSATFSVDQATVVGWAKAACFDTNDEVLAVVASAGYLNKADKLVEGQMPANGLNEVSNGLLTNQFADSTSSTKAVDIPDNNPVGISDTINFPDIGIAERLTVSVDIATSNVTQIKVFLYDPNSVEYKLHELTYNPDSTVKKLVTSYPDPTAPVSGNLATWVGKNPVGPWRLKVIDTQYLNNGFDGKIIGWSVNIQTLSSKKVQIAGDLNVTGKVTTGGDVTVGGKLTVVGQPVAAVWTAESDSLADGKTLDLNTGTSSPLLIAQAWFQQDDGSWLQASTAADVQTIGGCTECGNGVNGDFKATTNTNLAGGTYDYKSFTINQGVTVTVTGTSPLVIRVQGDAVIDGVLDLRGKVGTDVTSTGSCPGGAGGGGGGEKGGDGAYGSAGTNGGGTGHGGGAGTGATGGGGGGAGNSGSGTAGGTGSYSSGSGGSAGASYNDNLLSQGALGGSGGGAGGYGTAANSGGAGGGGGGGGVKLTAMKITIGAQGAILADGGAGGNVTGDYDGGAGGGGSGGTVWLRGSQVSILGQATAKAGAAGIANQAGSYWGGNGGAGAPGRIRVDGQIVGTTSPQYTPGDTLGLAPLVANKFLISQPTAGIVRLTNKSGKVQKVKLVIMK